VFFESRARAHQEFVSAAQGKPWPFVGAVACVRATETEVCVWYEAPGGEHLRWKPFNRHQLGLAQRPDSSVEGPPNENESGPGVATEFAQTVLLGLLRALAFEPDVTPADPDDRRLHQLAADPIFRRVPPGARPPSVWQSPPPTETALSMERDGIGSHRP
jgi:hypothetical protein